MAKVDDIQSSKEYEEATAGDCLINAEKFFAHPSSRLFLLEAPANVNSSRADYHSLTAAH